MQRAVAMPEKLSPDLTEGGGSLVKPAVGGDAEKLFQADIT